MTYGNLYAPFSCCVLDWSLIVQPTGKISKNFINFKYVHLNYHKENNVQLDYVQTTLIEV